MNLIEALDVGEKKQLQERAVENRRRRDAEEEAEEEKNRAIRQEKLGLRAARANGSNGVFQQQNGAPYSQTP